VNEEAIARDWAAAPSEKEIIIIIIIKSYEIQFFVVNLCCIMYDFAVISGCGN
jgi:hypothetical protein